MRPQGLKAKIFLDSFNPEETKEIISLLGFLDGQTTNPIQVPEYPYVKERFLKGDKFTKEEIFDFYKKIIIEISELIPKGSVSAEVYADENTTSDEIYYQAKEMFKWIPNAHIKYPIIPAGLEAAERGLKEGIKANLTLCFNQEQAAAVYSATKDAKKGDVFLSPFFGRLEDIGVNGITLIKNIIEMYKKGDGHVEVLSASIRNVNQLMAAIALGSDIITAKFSVLKEWAELGMPIPGEDFVYNSGSLKDITFEEIDLKKPWSKYDISDDMTTKGLRQFVTNWNSLIK